MNGPLGQRDRVIMEQTFLASLDHLDRILETGGLSRPHEVAIHLAGLRLVIRVEPLAEVCRA